MYGGVGLPGGGGDDGDKATIRPTLLTAQGDTRALAGNQLAQSGGGDKDNAAK
jgi:hypothetical protein